MQMLVMIKSAVKLVGEIEITYFADLNLTIGF